MENKDVSLWILPCSAVSAAWKALNKYLMDGWTNLSQCEDAALEMYEGRIYEGPLSEKKYQMSPIITEMSPISDVFSSRMHLGRHIRQKSWIFQLRLGSAVMVPPALPLSAALSECLLGDHRYISRHRIVFSSFDKCRKLFLQQRKDREHLETKF